jgi:hypothetical protein
VAHLEQTTDGWVAALQLASLSLRDCDDPAAMISRMSGRHHAIGEYLAENVLNMLDTEMVDFLMATSLTERINGDLACTLAGIGNGQALLEDAEERDLFLRRLDEEREWFATTICSPSSCSAGSLGTNPCASRSCMRSHPAGSPSTTCCARPSTTRWQPGKTNAQWNWSRCSALSWSSTRRCRRCWRWFQSCHRTSWRSARDCSSPSYGPMCCCSGRPPRVPRWTHSNPPLKSVRSAHPSSGP